MRKFRESISRHQLLLLPRSIEEYVPSEDSVRYVDELIEGLDLKEIESVYSENGRPAYLPRMLVKLLVYGKLRGIRTGRELSLATKENFRFIFLVSGEQPDFRTINLFRKRFSAELAGILKQTVRIGIEEGAIKLEHVCVDGTKIGASAGRNTFKTREKLEEELDKLERKFKKSFEQDIENEEEEDRKYGADDDGDMVLPAELKDKESRKKRLKRAIEEYNKKEGKRKICKVSTTDPEARYMRSKGTNPAYNAQAAIDADSKMIVGGYVTNRCTDECELVPVLNSIEELTDKYPMSVTADKGYSKKEDYLKLAEKKIVGYVAQRADVRKDKFRLKDFKYKKGQNLYICPNGKKLTYLYKDNNLNKHRYKCSDCRSCAVREKCLKHPNKPSQFRHLIVSPAEPIAVEMQKRVESEEGRARLKIRGSTIEPFFGIIKFARRLRQFTIRTLPRVNNEWLFELAAHNISKLAALRAAGS